MQSRLDTECCHWLEALFELSELKFSVGKAEAVADLRMRSPGGKGALHVSSLQRCLHVTVGKFEFVTLCELSQPATMHGWLKLSLLSREVGVVATM